MEIIDKHVLSTDFILTTILQNLYMPYVANYAVQRNNYDRRIY